MENPYSPSQTEPFRTSGESSVTPAVIQALTGTKPWVRLCSVLGFIGAGIMIIAALAMIIGGGAIMTSMDGGQGAAPGGLLAGLSVVYIGLAIFYLFPSIKLWKYGTYITRLMSSGSMADLEAALDAQRSFWKFVGLMICIMFGVYFIGGIIFGIAMTFLSASAASGTP